MEAQKVDSRVERLEHLSAELRVEWKEPRKAGQWDQQLAGTSVETMVNYWVEPKAVHLDCCLVVNSVESLVLHSVVSKENLKVEQMAEQKGLLRAVLLVDSLVEKKAALLVGMRAEPMVGQSVERSVGSSVAYSVDCWVGKSARSLVEKSVVQLAEWMAEQLGLMWAASMAVYLVVMWVEKWD